MKKVLVVFISFLFVILLYSFLPHVMKRSTGKKGLVAERTRRITVQEYRYALDFFQREFPVIEDIEISDDYPKDPVSPYKSHYAIFKTGNKIKICVGPLFDDCLGSEIKKEYFLHFLTHVWQAYKLGIASKACYYDDFIHTFECNNTKKLEDFDVDTQTEIVLRFKKNDKCAASICSKSITGINNWALMPGNEAGDVAVDEKNNFYMVNSKGVYMYNGVAWAQVRSGAAAITANAGKVWIVDFAGSMFELRNNSWIKMPGSDAKDIAISKDGIVWMVNTAGEIYKYANLNWTKLPGSSAARIGAGDQKVWMTNTVGKIYEFINGTWIQKTGSDAVDIAVSNNGVVLIVNTIGNLYKWEGDKWSLQYNPAKRVAANSYSSYAYSIMINKEGRLYQNLSYR